MREITRTLSVPVDGTPRDFRLTKLDAFSGVALLRLLSKMPAASDRKEISRCARNDNRGESDAPDGVIPSRFARPENEPVCSFSERIGRSAQEGSPSPAIAFLSEVPLPDLRAFMTVCLEHTEVRLPAGWIPVLTRGEWTYPELEYDTAACLKLTLEEATWTLEGFFAGGGSTSQKEIRDA